jgi:hypothetical protein
MVFPKKTIGNKRVMPRQTLFTQPASLTPIVCIGRPPTRRGSQPIDRTVPANGTLPWSLAISLFVSGKFTIIGT